jgi:hypothetical protein
MHQPLPSPRGGASMGHDRPQKITFGEMRSSGVRGLLIYARTIIAATRSRSARIHGLITFGSRIWNRASCAKACGKKGADVRPNFHWNGMVEGMVTVAALRKSSYLDTRDERPQRRSAGGRRPGAVSAGCGAGGGCKLPATHPSAFRRRDIQDVAASRSITSAASCARPHPPPRS